MTKIKSKVVEGIAPYEETAKRILNWAKKRKVGKRERGYSDDKALSSCPEIYKHYSNTEGLVSLIGAGAKVHCLNQRIISDKFYHEVLYGEPGKEHKFVDVTEYPISPVI